MHPREGWSEDGPPRPGLSRRSFLRQGAGAGLLAGGLGALLAACSSGATTAGVSGGSAIPLPRPNNPVTWPIFKDNPAIKSGLQPEQGATLKLYNWVAYINQQCLKDFGKKYNCKVEVTTFNNTSEAMAKLRSGQVSFDVFFPTIDLMGQLVEGKLIQPINHSYIPNITQAWSGLHQPLLRRQVAVHGARTRSTRPASPGVRTTCRRTPTRWRTRGPCPGRPSTRARWPSSTTTGRASASA